MFEVVPFTKLSPLVVKDYRQTKHSFQYSLERQPLITFENYILSQMHTNTLSLMYDNRNINDYYGAYKYLLTKDNKYMDKYNRVKNFFFEDVSSYYLDSSKEDIDVTCYNIIDRGVLPDINIDEVVDDLKLAMVAYETEDNSFESRFGIDYAQIILDNDLDKDKIKASLELYAGVILYLQYSKEDR